MKRIIIKILKKMGYRLVRDNVPHSKNKVSKNLKKNPRNTLLTSFFKLLNSMAYEPKVIFDIGAHKGDWTKDCLDFYPEAKYFLFEPQFDLCNEINNRFLKNDKIKVYNLGVGNVNGELEFMYFSFGEQDVYSVVNLPDNVSAATVALQINASGAAEVKTTVLLNPSDIDEVAKFEIRYRPPGG